ncbi:MAG TPA: PAS domain-containing sensor histidine kinase [Bacteroidia bacterium]|jgi:two-component system sensor histidine kinase VicK|nr:PAS domain-containing sensor histidine kinase [Bacteroidia bacterium]
MKIPLDQSLSNVKFIYDLELNQFIFVHRSLTFFLKEGKDFSEVYALIHPDDQNEVFKNFTALIKGTFSGTARFRLLFGGDERWYAVTPFLIALSTEKLIFGNALDITAEQQNIYSIEKYANKKNSILHVLAHELKGPLGLAKNLSQDLPGRLNDQTFVLNHLRLISRIISQSINIIEDFTDREFLETVRIELVKKRLNIVKKIGEYVEELNLSASTVKRKFYLTSSHKNIYVKLDEAKFMQVLNNLVSNALKFTRPGGHIAINIVANRNSVAIEFSDDGIGIPLSLQPFVFDEFTNAGRRGLRGEATMGLGLSIVKTIIEWHNGKISVHSKENEGTTFKIVLPRE